MTQSPDGGQQATSVNRGVPTHDAPPPALPTASAAYPERLDVHLHYPAQPSGTQYARGCTSDPFDPGLFSFEGGLFIGIVVGLLALLAFVHSDYSFDFLGYTHVASHEYSDGWPMWFFAALAALIGVAAGGYLAGGINHQAYRRRVRRHAEAQVGQTQPYGGF